LSDRNCDCIKTPNSTCHCDFEWEKPKIIDQISKLAGFKKENLKMSVLIVTRKNSKYNLENNSAAFRVVSERMLSKSGKYRFIVCGKDGRITLSMKKDLNVEFSEAFKNLKKYDLIKFAGIKNENGFELIKGNSLEIINTPSPHLTKKNP